MRIALLFVLVFCRYFVMSDSGACIIQENTMDCSNRQMNDCPEVNKSSSVLIMDHNLVTNLAGACGQWTHLSALYLSHNKLRGPADFSNFTKLSLMKARHNSITTAYFYIYLDLIDLSFNQLSKIYFDQNVRLRSLILGHNKLSVEAVNSFLNQDLVPSLQIMDLSYNNLRTLPMNFLSFKPSAISSINLAGNNLSEIYLQVFNYYTNIKLNLSYNLITSFILSKTPSLSFLDFSHNRLSSLDNTTLYFLFNIPKVDLSYNPFNCSCDFKPPFIKTMTEHKDTFVNQSSTNCSQSLGPNIFNMVCSNVSSQSSKWWIFLIVAVIILAILAVIFYAVLRSRRSGYSRIGDSEPSFHLPSWISMDCLRPRNVNVEPAISSEVTFSDQNIHFEDRLIILSTSKNRNWIVQQVIPFLTIDTEVIDFKLRKVPAASFILIVIYDDSDMNDRKLKNNVSLLVEGRQFFDLRLLLRGVPSADSLKKNNVLSRYLDEAIKKRSYFLFDAEYPLSCMDSLRAWLNVTGSRNDFPYSV